MIKNVILIGAGNLATQLGMALYDSGINILQVYSRTIDAAQSLAGKVNASFTNDLHAIKETCDLYIVAVTDDALEHVLAQVAINNHLVVHTAGSISMEMLLNYSENVGVFYPFQTFSKNKMVDFTKVPVCIEANTPENLKMLENLAKKVSYKIIMTTYEQRSALHIAAVFGNNFVNHLYTLSSFVLKENQLGLELLYPLLQETTEKVMKLGPLEAQTGPAFRGDKKIVENHLKLMENKPEIKKIYKLLSDSIYKLYHQ